MTSLSRISLFAVLRIIASEKNTSIIYFIVLLPMSLVYLKDDNINKKN